ncbi:DNA polymerase Y family protein [Alteromonas sp. 1_MG-2023]|uniref:Y-family DNA polymerase n=1 Tax=Alteromonas sp. 1_MG-2023 TaxID=3062669 RepID=UPI0026E331E5|nr:DNA polymerase Y family protein [Alteromonas sp. 1_MG-2023]MDO6566451.1 DNA polymerase Y family protein [Alteromonas sp. 1_MG-2023]
MMLWAYFYCYQLTLDSYKKVESATGSEVPTVVYHEKANQILQANTLAINEGIECGHGLAQAAALCPQVHILEYNRDAEKETLLSLANRLYPLASDIVIDSHNAIAIRLDNLLQYYGNLEALWRVLFDEITIAGIHFYFSTAWGVEAARLLAKNKTNKCTDKKETITLLLSGCRLEQTELDAKTIATLAKVGVRQIGQLLKLPVHELGQRFSNDTIRYLTALRGETFPQYVLFRPSISFQQTKTLSFEVENTQHLLPSIKALLQSLEHYLRARNLLSSSILFQVHFREEEPLPIEVNGAMPFATQKDWLVLVELKVETLLLPEPAIAVSLTCQQFEPIENDGNDFFSHRFTTVAQKQLIGRLKAKLGDGSTLHPKAGDSHTFEGMTVNHIEETSPSYASDITPAFLFCEPMPLHLSTRICFGPIRIQTEWWSNNPSKKDYFIAETSHGVRLLVFKDAKAHWWTQGLYS